MSEQKIQVQIESNAKKMSNSVDSLANSMSKAKNSVALMISNLKNMVGIVKKMTDYTDDYVSSMRLLSTVFDKTIDKSKTFISNMANMTGIKESTLTRQVALFGQLAKSFDMSEDYAEKFSEGLTTLSAKMAMLYNKDFDVMATSLQRSIQGTQETLKALTGIEVNELSESAILLSNGINREISSLNEAEMAIIRYASVVRAVTNEQYVYQESVNSLAWQKQILTNQVTKLAQAVGSVLYPILAKVLPVFNAILMVITELISMLAKLVGFEVSSTNATSEASAGYSDLANSITKANKAANKSLRSFDKLNNITTPSDSGSSGSSGLSIDPAILGLLDQTDKNLLNIKNKATEIRDRIMEWLGFTRNVNGEWELTEGKMTNIEKIFQSILGIISFIIGLKIAALVFKIVNKLNEVNGILPLISKFFTGVSSTPVLVVFGTIFAIALGIYEIINGIIDILQGDTLQGVLEIVSGIAFIVTGIALAMGGWVVAAVAALVAVGAAIAAWVVENKETISQFFSDIWNFLVEKFGGAADWVWTNIIKPIIDFFEPIVSAVTNVVKNIIGHVSEIVVTIGKAILEIIKKIGEILAKFIEIFVAIGKAFYTYVIKPILDKYLIPAVTWIYDHIIKPIWDKFVWLKDTVAGLFEKIGIAISDFIFGAIKGAINAVFSKIENAINGFIRLLNKAIDIINKIPRSFNYKSVRNTFTKI